MSGDLSQSAGVRLAIHNPDSYPLVDEFGHNIQPGTASSVAVQMARIKCCVARAAFRQIAFTLTAHLYTVRRMI